MSDSSRYDRQIRVWGAEAQARIQTSKVLIVNLINLNVEVVKNLVLAGVNVTLLDPRVVGIHELQNNFFVTMDDLNQPILDVAVPRIQELNTFTEVKRVQESLHSLSDTFFLQFQVIIFSGWEENDVLKINNLVRSQGTICFWSEGSGDEAMFFSDFGPSFQYLPDPNPTSAVTASSTANSSDSSSSSNEVKNKTELKTIAFPAFATLLQQSWHTIPTKFQPLSKVFINLRTLQAYRHQYQQNPKVTDQETLFTLLQSLLATNLIDSKTVVNDTITSSSSSAQQKDSMLVDWSKEMQLVSAYEGYAHILTCSVLGSELSQEIIKAISKSGQPGNNVWVYSGNSLSVRAFPVSM